MIYKECPYNEDIKKEEYSGMKTRVILFFVCKYVLIAMGRGEKCEGRKNSGSIRYYRAFIGRD
jgi:hypothetical protein